MQQQLVADDHLSLTDVAKIAPGRPSANCVWRWCRRGVLARSGERIRLEHVRVGGKIFTRRCWLDEFGRRLAEEDARYFSLRAATAKAASGHDGSPHAADQTKPSEDRRRAEIAAAEHELDQRGVR
ncbi:MAG: hypothetical protein U1D55_00085 [Phycisphaerae bacterium]